MELWHIFLILRHLHTSRNLICLGDNQYHSLTHMVKFPRPFLFHTKSSFFFVPQILTTSRATSTVTTMYTFALTFFFYKFFLQHRDSPCKSSMVLAINRVWSVINMLRPCPCSPPPPPLLSLAMTWQANHPTPAPRASAPTSPPLCVLNI